MKNIYKNLIFILLLLSVAFNSYLLKTNNNFKLVISDVQNKLSMQNIELSDLISDFNNQDSLQFFSNNLKLSGELPFVSMSSDRSLFLLNELIVSPKVVIFWDQRFCSDCYESYLQDINEVMKTYGSDRFIFVGKFNSPREFDIFLKSKNISCKAFEFQGNALGLPIENGDYPFVFKIGKTLVVKHVFALDKKFYQKILTRFISIID